MTALLSSPIESRHVRLGAVFQQPSSPTFQHEDLPSEFGDRSFGSSMSLGSSFDLAAAAAAATAAAAAAGASNEPARSTISPSNSFGAQMRLAAAAGARTAAARSERQRLGAAMGTALNDKSPGLAAKLSSPHYMDISPPPSGTHSPTLIETPGRAANSRSGSTVMRPSGSALGLAPGSDMETDTPLLDRVARRHFVDSPVAPGSAGGSLGRLFGTELSLNADESPSSSPDKEPPSKRRPSSLPLGQSEAPVRPSMRTAGLMPTQSAAGRRPNLMKSMTTASGSSSSSGAVARKRSSMESLAGHEGSGSLSFGAAGRPPRVRAASAESTASEFLGGRSAEYEGSRTSMPTSHSTIIESPSPGCEQNQLSSYFFDPASPEALKHADVSTSKLASRRPNLSINLASSSSQPDSSPTFKRPGPRPLGGSRVFEKTASSAVLPTFSHALGMSGVGPTKSSLGKRANPYARPSIAPLSGASLGDRALKTAYPILGGPSTRPTAPAPRRCVSSLDNSAVFAQQQQPPQGRSMMLSADLSSPDAVDRRFPDGFDASGSPIAPSARPRARPGLLRRTSKDDSSPLGYGNKRNDAAEALERCINLNESPMAIGSPSYGAECMPGFGASEKQGKVLPCFTVKDDGLMRIKPQTLVNLMSGMYQDQIIDYHVVDCRFGYEFEGGHVPGAVNLSTIERVKAHFLTPGQGLHATRPMPPRSQSSAPDCNGNTRKTVLVFHCEFSCKRAPSLALALRHADRALQQDWPSCHFPELYILEGGYCAFFKAFPTACEPQRYVEMDDPTYSDQRSSEISGFRKQFAPKQPFNRHRSFTFGERTAPPNGEGAGASKLRSGFLAVSKGHAGSIREEESSFDDSPSAAQADAAARKKLSLPVANFSSGGGVGDMSFGSSVGDSSFDEGGPSDSPCAVAARRPSQFGLVGAPPMPQQPRLGNRLPMQRAATSANVLGR